MRPRTSRRLQRRLLACPRRTPAGQGLLSSLRAPTPPSLSPQRRVVSLKSRRLPSTPSAAIRSTTPTVPVMHLPVVSSPVSSRASRLRRPSTWVSGSQSSASRSSVPRTRSPSRLTAAKRFSHIVSVEARVFQQSTRWKRHTSREQWSCLPFSRPPHDAAIWISASSLHRN